ncbi:MAG: MHS family MFS transporter [Alicyclobacillus sp.]|nr:MHS family MFS transporter [Alicyclobacillus sp.]
MAEKAVSENSVATKRQVRLAAISSTVGTSIEWYDFFLYGTAAALVFPHLFFPKSSAYAGILESFATYAVGFVARPVGAAIFGHWGDKVGRKAMLIVTLLLMGLSSAAIGVLPTSQSVGVWGAILVTVMRVLQGIGVGGEWGGSVLISMEWGNKKKRGLMASWPQLGVPIGLLLSSLMVSLFSLMGSDRFNSWGWRIPFLLSLVLVIIGLWIRLQVLESPIFERVMKEKQEAKVPVAEALAKYPKEIILSALARMSEQAPFYIFITYIVSYGTTAKHYSHSDMTLAVTLAAILSLFSVPFFGSLSDRIGRKKMYLMGAVATLIWAFPYFGLVNTGVTAVMFVAVIVSMIPHDMQYGPQAALIAEHFPARIRYSGSSIGYQLASVVAGGPAPLVATMLFHQFGTAYAVSAYIVFNAIVTIIAVSFMRERSKVDIDVSVSDGGTAVGQ